LKDAQFIDANEDADALSVLTTPTLFGDDSWVVVDNADSLKIAEFECRCILLAEKLQLPGIKLDLRTEKPWDRKKRIVSHFGETYAYLYDLTGGDPIRMEQEIEKCTVYTEGKPVTRDVIEKLCTKQSDQRLFKISESIAFGIGKPPDNLPDKNDLFALIGQLRYHYKIGLTLAEKREVKGNLPPKTLAQYKSIAGVRGIDYFVQSLLNLFTLELKAKTTTLNPENLYAKLLYDTLSPAESAR